MAEDFQFAVAARQFLGASREPTAHQRALDALKATATDSDIPPRFVDLAHEVARLGEQDPEIQYAHVVLGTLIFDAERRGSTRVALDSSLNLDVRKLLLELQASEVAERVREIAAGGSLLVGIPGDAKPYIVSRECVYGQHMQSSEARVAELCAARLTTTALVDRKAIDEALEAVSTLGPDVLLSKAQRAAVRLAATESLSLITGGPGTGKTSVVAALLEVLERSGSSVDAIALAAPTGKAAHRLSESMANAKPEPMTLHRLLGFRGRGFQFGKGNPLPAEVVIVDESSMIDISLMRHLLEAVSPAARLVLLGDAEQLPSVSAGAVFRDLERAAAGRVARLEENFRLTGGSGGAQLAQFADEIRSGIPDAARIPTLRSLEASHPKLARPTFSGAELVDESVSLDTFLRHWQRLPPGDSPAPPFQRDTQSDEWLVSVLDHCERQKILTVTRGAQLSTGASALNARVHAMFVEKAGAAPDVPWLPGEPVMVQRNNYELGVFNGDHGVIVRIAGELKAAFRTAEGVRAFFVDALVDDIELAHAMTVHKSQGSEYDRVALVLPRSDHPLLSRELVYTAVTRARASVVMVGTRARLAAAIARPTSRSTGLPDRIAATQI